MPRLAIVIPTLGQIKNLETTLVSVLENRPPQTEILVVHQGDYADPYQLAGEVEFVIRPGSLCPVADINLGVERCGSPFFQALPPGARVTPGWTQSPLRHFRAGDLGAVAVGQCGVQGDALGLTAHQLDRDGMPCEVIGQGTAAWTGPATWGGFFRRSTWDALGGLDPYLGAEFAEVDLALRMTAAGIRCQVEAESQVFLGTGRPRSRPGFRRGLYLERLFRRHRESGAIAPAAHHWRMLGELGCGVLRPSLGLQFLGRCWQHLSSLGRSDRRCQPVVWQRDGDEPMSLPIDSPENALADRVNQRQGSVRSAISTRSRYRDAA